MQFADATIYGNLTRDADMFEYGDKKTAGAQIGVAVNRHYTQNEEKKTETSFFNATIYGNIVKSIGEFLTKGRSVIARGRLVQDHYERAGKPALPEERMTMEERYEIQVVRVDGSRLGHWRVFDHRTGYFLEDESGQIAAFDTEINAEQALEDGKLLIPNGNW